MDEHFHQQRPAITDKRADVIHQYSHTEEHTLPAFLNRCIDTLLNHAPAELDTPQPNLANLEHSGGYLLLQNGQHIIGDRRRTIQREMLRRLREEVVQSDSQGQVWKLDPKQCKEVRNLAWRIGKTKHFLPALLTALWADNLLDFSSFAGAEFGPCTHCNCPESATAAHFLCGADFEATRSAVLHPALIRAVRNRSIRNDISDADIITALTTIPDADPLAPSILDTDPDAIIDATPGGKPVIVCPICRRNISFSERLGRTHRHNCIPTEDEDLPADLEPFEFNSNAVVDWTSTGKPIFECPICKKRAAFSEKLGRLHKHNCVDPNDENKDIDDRQHPVTITQIEQPRASLEADPTKRICPDCTRLTLMNQDGRLRKHNCAALARKRQRTAIIAPTAPAPIPPPPPPSPSPASSYSQDVSEARPIPPYRIWMHRRTQNAKIIATFTGIMTTVALAFLQFCISDQLARATAIKDIRTAWLDYAYAAWQEHRRLMKAKEMPPSRKYIRNRKSCRIAKRGKDPPKKSSARRRKTKASLIDPEAQESDRSTESKAELSSPPIERSIKRARKSHCLMHHQSGDDDDFEFQDQDPPQEQDQDPDQDSTEPQDLADSELAQEDDSDDDWLPSQENDPAQDQDMHQDQDQKDPDQDQDLATL